MTGALGGKRALVTGGAGFIGGHLVDRLVDDGWKVRVVDDFSTGRDENLASSRDRIELIRGDIRDGELIGRAVEGVEVVFHQAAIPSVSLSLERPLLTDEVNLHATVGLLEAARRSGVRRFVFAASCAAYGDDGELPKRESLPVHPVSPYALQKYAGEQYCRIYYELHGLSAVSLRYFNVFGPRQNPESEYAAVVPLFVRALLKGAAPRIFGDGEQTRDFVYVDDVVRSNLLAAASERAAGRVINVASGSQTSVNELVAVLRELTDSSVEPIHEPARMGEVRHSVADLARARELLGYEPSIDLREGLRRTIDNFRGSLGGGTAG